MGKMLDIPECDDADMYAELSCGRCNDDAGKTRQHPAEAPLHSTTGSA
jgi:hypothetical protein